MEKHQRQSNFGGVEPSSGFVELPGTLNLKHQVATAYVLHHKKQSILDTTSSPLTLQKCTQLQGKFVEQKINRKLKTRDNSTQQNEAPLQVMKYIKNPCSAVHLKSSSRQQLR